MHKMRRARQVEWRQGQQRPFGTQVAFARVATGLGWTSLGALAIGASAAGAVAIGALAIRALAVKRGSHVLLPASLALISALKRAISSRAWRSSLSTRA